MSYWGTMSLSSPWILKTSFHIGPFSQSVSPGGLHSYFGTLQLLTRPKNVMREESPLEECNLNKLPILPFLSTA